MDSFEGRNDGQLSPLLLSMSPNMCLEPNLHLQAEIAAIVSSAYASKSSKPVYEEATTAGAGMIQKPAPNISIRSIHRLKMYAQAARYYKTIQRVLTPEYLKYSVVEENCTQLKVLSDLADSIEEVPRMTAKITVMDWLGVTSRTTVPKWFLTVL